MPRWVVVDRIALNQANRYFGAVGLVVGFISAAVYWAAAMIFPASVAIILAMICSMFVTGGFHEDGLADTADGLGGGWRVADKLRIMKDSRLGSYGALALVSALILKWQLLLALSGLSEATVVSSGWYQWGDVPKPDHVMLAIIIAHTLSRVVATSLIFSEPYVQDDDKSKSKPLAETQTVNDLYVLVLTGISVCFLGVSILSSRGGLEPFESVLALAFSALMVRWIAARFLRRQIGGITGDTLGAVQQVSELVCYGVLFMCWSAT
ncbi:adenosylcobinamide-GDP ribazoletransferase [Shewanella gelidii]|uniref:Adenosylcobinamide-GDP ribazoletransferase n=2 Tax=Shewanella gelidii TaxID=1642821 RepID=A0A917JMN4_9GAMM|nr:adenosylcobinamide-GDP ribazoletransferase [Shewanella gelidii]